LLQLRSPCAIRDQQAAFQPLIQSVPISHPNPPRIYEWQPA
jgi:hypothetical protein